MSILKWLMVVVFLLVAVAAAAGQAGFLQGETPADLGVSGGKLKPPALTPNSVSSQAALYPDHPQRQFAEIAPLALRTDGVATIARLKRVVEAMPGTKVVRSEPDYLYVQYTTRWMKFVDDVEFWYDPTANVVQARSASRIGESDLGANRKRVEAVRKALAEQP